MSSIAVLALDNDFEKHIAPVSGNPIEDKSFVAAYRTTRVSYTHNGPSLLDRPYKTKEGSVFSKEWMANALAFPRCRIKMAELFIKASGRYRIYDESVYQEKPAFLTVPAAMLGYLIMPTKEYEYLRSQEGHLAIEHNLNFVGPLPEGVEPFVHPHSRAYMQEYGEFQNQIYKAAQEQSKTSRHIKLALSPVAISGFFMAAATAAVSEKILPDGLAGPIQAVCVLTQMVIESVYTDVIDFPRVLGCMGPGGY